MRRESTKVTVMSRWPLYKGDRYDKFDCIYLTISKSFYYYSALVSNLNWNNVLFVTDCQKPNLKGIYSSIWFNSSKKSSLFRRGNWVFEKRKTIEKLIPYTPSDNKQEIVETHVNTEIASVNIKDDKTVIKKECDDTVNQAPVINFPVFNTDSSQQSLARFIVEK